MSYCKGKHDSNDPALGETAHLFYCFIDNGQETTQAADSGRSGCAAVVGVCQGGGTLNDEPLAICAVDIDSMANLPRLAKPASSWTPNDLDAFNIVVRN